MARDIILLDDVTANNLGVFRKINATTLSHSFSDSFYTNSLDNSLIVKLAYYSELPIAAIRATPVELKNPSALSASPDAIYVNSLAVLPAYQNLGVGKKLVEYLLEETKKKFIHNVAISIEENNTTALCFLEKLGFTRGELLDGKYLLSKSI